MPCDVSMHIATRITLLVAPLLVMPAAGLAYTIMNISDRMFVEKLGCGCDPFFNTNHLSLTVSGGLLVSAAVSWGLASRGLSRWWLCLLVAAFVVLGRLFFQQFMDHNLWK